MTAMVSVRELRKNYGSFTALDGVSFDIEQGETFALLGPNGAGKSTTIEILEGYRDRTSGDASVLGVDPGKGGVDWKARLGIVLQSTGESGNATVREQLTHFAGFYSNARDVDEVIAAVGLEEKQKTFIRKLSGGQRRRVDVALGIIGRPELLFLDEPTVGVDVVTKARLRDFLRELNREQGTTILLTTHDMHDIEALCSRVVVIDHGRIMHDGDLLSLKARYGARKRLVFTLTAAADLATADLPRGAVEWHQPSPLQAVASVAEGADTAQILQRALAALPVANVQIEEPTIDQVVKELYERKA